MRMTRQVTRQKKIFPHPKIPSLAAQKAAITQNQRENTNFEAPANRKTQTEDLPAQPVAKRPPRLGNRRKLPRKVHPNPKRTFSEAGFLLKPCVYHPVL
jgi:hypothetical protein